MSANTWLAHDCLKNRYCFTGMLRLETGLHIGNGRSSTLTDAQIIRTADGIPYIPGSSFKGALRSAVERIVPNIPVSRDIRTCQLIENDAAECLTVSRRLQKRLQDLREKSETAQRAGQGYSGVADKNEVNWLLDHHICNKEELAKPAFARHLPYCFIEYTLCHTCQLFGSTAFASKLRVNDLHIQGNWLEMTEIRDGVGIDRDTETAKPKIKFNLEVMPSETEFTFRLDAENLNERDLGLLCIGLQEFRTGSVPLGGRSTRGLGQCRLILEGVYRAELERIEDLITYLTTVEDSKRMKACDIDEFISVSIRALLRGE